MIALPVKIATYTEKITAKEPSKHAKAEYAKPENEGDIGLAAKVVHVYRNGELWWVCRDSLELIDNQREGTINKISVIIEHFDFDSSDQWFRRQAAQMLQQMLRDIYKLIDRPQAIKIISSKRKYDDRTVTMNLDIWHRLLMYSLHAFLVGGGRKQKFSKHTHRITTHQGPTKTRPDLFAVPWYVRGYGFRKFYIHTLIRSCIHSGDQSRKTHWRFVLEVGL